MNEIADYHHQNKQQSQESQAVDRLYRPALSAMLGPMLQNLFCELLLLLHGVTLFHHKSPLSFSFPPWAAKWIMHLDLEPLLLALPSLQRLQQPPADPSRVLAVFIAAAASFFIPRQCMASALLYQAPAK
jgi:hypothetical protein